MQAFADGVIDIPADPGIAQDLRALEEVDGIAMVLKVRRSDVKDPDLLRHGDSAVMLALGWFATLNLSAPIEFTALPVLARGLDKSGADDGDGADDGVNDNDQARDYLHRSQAHATW